MRMRGRYGDPQARHNLSQLFAQPVSQAARWRARREAHEPSAGWRDCPYDPRGASAAPHRPVQPFAVTPNFVAYLALAAWLPVAISIYFFMRPTLATAVVLIFGALFLPERLQFDLPVLPPFDKFTFSCLAALIGCLIRCPERLRAGKYGRGLDWLMWIMCLGTIGTTLTNRERLIFGSVVLPDLTDYDSVALIVKDLLDLGLPYFLARAVFTRERDLRDFLRVLAIGGLIYSFLCLIEMRLSPQLHNWIYGFHQHSFIQSQRFGGYRPTVFLQHGLAVAMYMLGAGLAALALARCKVKLVALPAWPTAWFITLVFVLCKSMGAVVYSMFAVPVVAFMKPERSRRIALGLGVLLALYPAMRFSDTFPADELVELADRVSGDRASSLEDRFEMEDALMERARAKPWFGWGGYRRSRVWDEQTGKDLSVNDGDWMLQLGMRGVVGFVARYLMLLIPLWIASRRMSGIRRFTDRQLIGTLLMISALFDMDLLPNGLYTYLPYVFAGVLYGTSNGIHKAHQLALRRRRAMRDRAHDPDGELQRPAAAIMPAI